MTFMPRPFEFKRPQHEGQKHIIIDERWLYCAGGDEKWIDCKVDPSMCVHLVKLPYRRLIEQTYTYIRFRVEDVGMYDGQIINPHGSDWTLYGTDASKDRPATSAIWRRKHDPNGWKDLRIISREFKPRGISVKNRGTGKPLISSWIEASSERDLLVWPRPLPERYMALLNSMEPIYRACAQRGIKPKHVILLKGEDVCGRVALGPDDDVHDAARIGLHLHMMMERGEIEKTEISLD
jgi:hypothetical protein